MERGKQESVLSMALLILPLCSSCAGCYDSIGSQVRKTESVTKQKPSETPDLSHHESLDLSKSTICQKEHRRTQKMLINMEKKKERERKKERLVFPPSDFGNYLAERDVRKITSYVIKRVPFLCLDEQKHRLAVPCLCL